MSLELQSKLHCKTVPEDPTAPADVVEDALSLLKSANPDEGVEMLIVDISDAFNNIPVRSFMFHLVITTTIAPPGCKR